ncbi:hypothetical protein EDD80_112117 [Anseongella ginsenosidimutans]|uniref:Restriction endonuclease type I HsdR N-terminal domain-containing protein n=2 Tax=Anseongella ginsenosidimutans TaxID=496056 RepID=A0A4R3KNG3_9SPHI|nr:hypothetical protein EDD80_112117 [Anseongella ginsenosidimutans]
MQFAGRVEKLLPQIQTEEATKNALIMPFIQLLGYDVFNPFEVNPEFIADLGIKKGEKVDYAIIRDGQPVILVECKHHADSLDPHNSQLFRYFHTTDAKFGLLSNGLHYRFYTDLIKPNKMDEKPFFEFKINEIRDNEIQELKKFHKSYFNLENIANTASELKFLNEVKMLLNKELSSPTEDFVRFFAKQTYPTIVTAKVLEQFTSITKRAFNQILNDLINERLKTALNKENESEAALIKPETKDTLKAETTQDEIDGYLIIKSILRAKVDVQRVVMRDNQTYCAILLDDNNRKPICRLYFNGKKKQLALVGANKKEAKYEIASLDDIYQYSEELLKTAEVY